MSIKIAGVLAIAATAVFTSCKKADSELPYGSSKIFMPQAVVRSGGVDNNFPVPFGVDSATFNFVTDRANGKVHVLLGASLSGPEENGFSVNIDIDSDTATDLLASVYNPANYMLMPASMYTMPDKLEVAAGQRGASFRVSLDIAQLKQAQYAGKFLLLPVRISNPSRYELNTKLSTTIMIVDVNTLVIGPAVNITQTYIKNPGNPFRSNGFMAGSTRWGNLLDWQSNTAARSHGGFGGFSSDNGGTMNMESGWGSPQILNGKIWQTITLPAGRYTFDISGGNWTGGEHFMKDIGYAVVAPNVDELPDYATIAGNTALYTQTLTKSPQAPIVFTLTESTKISLGIVVNYAQDQQGFKSKQVLLYSYPNAL